MIGYNKLTINSVNILVVETTSINANFYNSFKIACDNILFERRGKWKRVNAYALTEIMGKSTRYMNYLNEKFKANTGADDLLNFCEVFGLNYRFFFEDNQQLCNNYECHAISIYSLISYE